MKKDANGRFLGSLFLGVGFGLAFPIVLTIVGYLDLFAQAVGGIANNRQTAETWVKGAALVGGALSVPGALVIVRQDSKREFDMLPVLMSTAVVAPVTTASLFLFMIPWFIDWAWPT